MYRWREGSPRIAKNQENAKITEKKGNFEFSQISFSILPPLTPRLSKQTLRGRAGRGGTSGIDKETNLRRFENYVFSIIFAIFRIFSSWDPPPLRLTVIVDPQLDMYEVPRPGGRPGRLARVTRWLCLRKDST